MLSSITFGCGLNVCFLTSFTLLRKGMDSRFCVLGLILSASRPRSVHSSGRCSGDLALQGRDGHVLFIGGSLGAQHFLRVMYTCTRGALADSLHVSCSFGSSKPCLYHRHLLFTPSPPPGVGPNGRAPGATEVRFAFPIPSVRTS